MTGSTRPTFGDNVAIRSTPETEAMGFAGKTGSITGFTTPSVTGISVIGAPNDDYALAVMFDDRSLPDRWFTEDLLLFRDHAPGLEIRIGNLKAVRAADGSWIDTRDDDAALESRLATAAATRPWWKFGEVLLSVVEKIGRSNTCYPYCC